MNKLTWLEINLKNLKHNIHNLKSLLKSKEKFMAVIKSNAYGHGMIECARAAVEAGADWLGAVNIEEAFELRNKLKVKNIPILVLGYVKPDNFQIAAKNNISIAIVNFNQLDYLIANGQKLKADLKIHLKIETGVSRLGFPENSWAELINELKKLPKNIIIEGVYSHFASVEEYDLEYVKKQIEKFKKFKKSFRLSAISYQPIYHMAASAATMILPESHFDMVRCGVAIYGLWPSKETKDSFLSNIKTLKHKNIKTNNKFLKPVLEYKTKIVQIKEVNRGDYIGYGCTYPVEKPMTVAVIPVGYAEGFDRGFSNPAPAGNKSGEVLIWGKRCPVLGRICMNMTIIDISQLISNYQLPISKINNEYVTLIGRQNVEEITADEWAQKLGTINYEITTRIPENITRVYK